MTDKRFLVVGIGSIGARHLRNLRALFPDAQIAVLRREASAPGLVAGADHVFRELDQAIAFAPDAAVIAGPAPWHVPVAISLAQAGVHLFIEKPIAIDCESACTLVEMCRAHALVLAVGYDLRFDPVLAEFRNLVQTGVVGDVYSVRSEVGQYLPDWRPGTDYRQGVSARAELGGGVLLELSHEFDYLQWIFGMPTRVMALGGRSGQLEIDVEDIAEVLLDYGSNGPWVSVHLDMLQRQPIRRCRVVGTRGTIVWDGVAGHIELAVGGGALSKCFKRDALSNGNQAYLDEIKNFVASMEGQEVPKCPGEDAVKALSLALAGRQSIAQGSAVFITSEKQRCGA